MANDIDKTSPHYKGEFGSIYEVNQKFPNGGVVGDYVEIDGWAHYWNANRGTWCVNAQRDSYWDELITGIIEKFKLIKGATYMGVAGLDTVPQAFTGAKMYYFATVAGTYKNFGGLVVPQGINVLLTEDGKSWTVQSLISVAQELGDSTTMMVSQKVVTDNLTELQNTVFPLEVSLSLDKSLLEYTGSEQSIKATYSIKRKGSPITPTALDLSVDGSLVSIDVKQADTVTIKVNKEGETQIILTAKHGDLVKSALSKVTMVLPIYYGFGTTETDIAIAANKLSPRLSASGTYAKTSAKDDVNFIILAPKTLPKLTNFTMGGAPFVMETSSVTINGKDYYMYKSGAIYMNGATLNVQAN